MLQLKVQLWVEVRLLLLVAKSQSAMLQFQQILKTRIGGGHSTPKGGLETNLLEW